MLASSASNKILPVTSIRFFAALYVLLFHVVTGDEDSSTRGLGVVHRTLALGYVSVSFFFFLSGFVLAITYCTRAEKVPARNFFLSRFARIYPALAACLLLDLPHQLYADVHLLHHSAGDVLTMLLISFAALEAWFPHRSGLDAASWSITVEMFFYLIFPFVAMRLWRMRPARMWAFAAGTYAAGNLLVLYLMLRGVSMASIGWNPLTHVAEFLTGLCLAKLFLAISSRPAWSARLASLAPAFLAVSAAVFLAIPMFRIPVPVMLLQHSILLPLYGLTILALASGHRTITRILSVPWLVTLGEASFALYLIHAPLFALLRRPIEKAPAIGIPLGIGLAIGLSVLSFLYLETPARRYILNRAHARSRENEVVASMAQ